MNTARATKSNDEPWWTVVRDNGNIVAMRVPNQATAIEIADALNSRDTDQAGPILAREGEGGAEPGATLHGAMNDRDDAVFWRQAYEAEHRRFCDVSFAISEAVDALRGDEPDYDLIVEALEAATDAADSYVEYSPDDAPLDSETKPDLSKTDIYVYHWNLDVPGVGLCEVTAHGLSLSDAIERLKGPNAKGMTPESLLYIETHEPNWHECVSPRPAPHSEAPNA